MAMMKIDGSRLKELVERTGTTLVKASKMLGYSDSALSHASARNTISPSMMISLEHAFGIRLEDYIASEDAKPEDQPLPNEDTLRRIIREEMQAVLNEMLK